MVHSLTSCHVNGMHIWTDAIIFKLKYVKNKKDAKSEQRSEPRGRQSIDTKFPLYKSMTGDGRQDKAATVLYSTTFNLINAGSFPPYKILVKPVEFLSEHTFSNVSAAYQQVRYFIVGKELLHPLCLFGRSYYILLCSTF